MILIFYLHLDISSIDHGLDLIFYTLDRNLFFLVLNEAGLLMDFVCLFVNFDYHIVKS
jgi:hypothetical protein